MTVVDGMDPSIAATAAARWSRKPTERVYGEWSTAYGAAMMSIGMRASTLSPWPLT
jgi:hypothetical protein